MSSPIVTALQSQSFEVSHISQKPGHLRVVGRVPLDARTKLWHRVIVALDRANLVPNAGWSVDISKKYLSKGDEPAYLWRVIFESSDLEAHEAKIASIIANVRAPGGSSEVTSFPLTATSSNRNDTGGGRRGATPIRGRD